MQWLRCDAMRCKGTTFFWMQGNVMHCKGTTFIWTQWLWCNAMQCKGTTVIWMQGNVMRCKGMTCTGCNGCDAMQCNVRGQLWSGCNGRGGRLGNCPKSSFIALRRQPSTDPLSDWDTLCLGWKLAWQLALKLAGIISYTRMYLDSSVSLCVQAGRA